MALPRRLRKGGAQRGIRAQGMGRGRGLGETFVPGSAGRVGPDRLAGRRRALRRRSTMRPGPGRSPVNPATPPSGLRPPEGPGLKPPAGPTGPLRPPEGPGMKGGGLGLKQPLPSNATIDASALPAKPPRGPQVPGSMGQRRRRRRGRRANMRPYG
jgi:hypothetical protein